MQELYYKRYSETDRSKNFLYIIFIICLNSVGHFVSDMYLPMLPILGRYFGCDDTYLQLTVSFYFLGFAFSSLFFGPYSDLIGRKNVILMGNIIAIISTVICYIAPNAFILTLGRILQGVSLGAITSSVRALITDQFSHSALAKFISLSSIVTPIMVSIAPNISSFILTYYSWQKTFVFLLIYFCLILFFTLFIKNTNLIQQNRSSLFSNIVSLYRDICSNKRFILFSLFIALTWIGISALSVSSPFLFQNIMGFTIHKHGMLFIYNGLMMILGGLINLGLLRYFTPLQILPLGIFIVLLSGVSLAIGYYYNYFHYLALITYLLYFSAVPIILSNSFSLTCALGNQDYGTINAFLLFIQLFAAGISAFIFAFLPSMVLSLVFLIFFIFLTQAILLITAILNSWFKVKWIKNE